MLLELNAMFLMHVLCIVYLGWIHEVELGTEKQSTSSCVFMCCWACHIAGSNLFTDIFNFWTKIIRCASYMVVPFKLKSKFRLHSSYKFNKGNLLSMGGKYSSKAQGWKTKAKKTLFMVHVKLRWNNQKPNWRKFCSLHTWKW